MSRLDSLIFGVTQRANVTGRVSKGTLKKFGFRAWRAEHLMRLPHYFIAMGAEVDKIVLRFNGLRLLPTELLPRARSRSVVARKSHTVSPNS